jgi:lantibiotic modifying enzyme
LYGGTSGAALFLAELYRATGDAAARTTALGAIRQALSRADSIAPIDRVGFFDGWTGIAVAATRVGLLTDEEGLLRAAQNLLRGIDPQHSADLQCGVISGAAGAIPALLALGELLRDGSSIDHAVRLGDGLLASADKHGNRWSWKLAKVSGEMNLTGFSHGTAGVACALLELFQASGDERYRSAAERAFEYERHWFDAKARNWPDFRGYGRRAVRRHDVVPCSAFWCHGAPGIAVSRIRAYEITQDPTCKAEAMVALQTTRESTERALDAQTMNFSLCHGLAGNGEILLLGERSLGKGFADAARLSTEIALAAADRLTAASPSRSLDVGGPAAGLMVGLAGLGYFYLRLENPDVPSMLFLDSRRLATTTGGGRSDAVRPSAAMSS